MNRKKIFLLALRVFCLALALAFGFFGVAPRVHAETVVGGGIATDTVWTKEGSPYLVNSRIIVASTSKLTIESGVTVRMVGHGTDIIAWGTLLVLGNQEEGIVIESGDVKDHSISAYGGVMDMRYVSISNLMGLFGWDKSSVRLDHVMLLADAWLGIYGSDLVATNSFFSNWNHSVGVGIFYSKGFSSTALIRNSTFMGSQGMGLLGEGAVSVDARHNFWGDASGPYSTPPDENFSGKGARVYGSVSFRPWLTADPLACCSSVLFLPGLEASRLYVADGGSSATSAPSGENRLWEPNRDKGVETLRLTSSGVSVNSVYVKVGDVIDEAYVSLAGPNIYKSFMSDMDELVATGTIQEWVPAAYDWRLSLSQLLEKGKVLSSASSSVRSVSYLKSTSTPYIIQEFDRLARESHTGRVSVVAHSNGGLVAKALALRLEERGDETLIDKMVFVGVPQTGTPHAIGALLHGFKEGIPLLASAPALRRLGQNMPGAYNLLPSARYLALDSRPLVTFSATTSSSSLRDLRGAYGSGINLFSALTEFLKGSEGRGLPAYADLSLPEKLSDGLLFDASAEHDGLDAWTPSPSSELFQIAGRGIDTVSGLEYYEGKKGRKPILLYRPLLISDGDGTVVSQSAWATPASVNVSKYWVDLKAASRGLSRNRSHADMLEVKDLRDFIGEILSEPPHAIRHRSQVSPAAVIPPKDPQKKIRVFVHSPDVVVSATDVPGNHTGISRSTGLVETQIPESEYREFGDVIYVSVPEGRVMVSPSGFATSTDIGEIPPGSVTINIEEVFGDEVIASSTYGDIAVATSSVIIIDITATTTAGATSTVPVVGVDDGGDGIMDREVMPGDTQEDPMPESASGPMPEMAVVSRAGSRSGGRHKSGGSVPVDASSSTEPFTMATTGPSMTVVRIDLAPVPAKPVATTTFANVSTSSATASTASTLSSSTSNPHIAASYVAGEGISRLSSRLPVGMPSLLLLILALLLTLAILWFLSCKISKSE